MIRVWTRKIGAWALTLGLLVSPALGEEIAPLVDLPELPAEENGEMALLLPEEDPMIGPHEEGYLFAEGESSPWGYADPSITVSIGEGRIYDTWYMYARVKIATPQQIRTMAAEDNLSRVTTVMGATLAKRVKAVVAINGVLEADISSGSTYAFVGGPVLRQGVWKRPAENVSDAKLEKWEEESCLDTLVIEDTGDLRILRGDTWGEIYREIISLGDHAVNVLCFGPALILDGEPQYGYNSRQMSTHRVAQRMAICQTGPLEYLLITSEGPENPDSKGLLLDQFVELLASFPEIETAYNLDGGSSSTLVFRKGSENWAKINCPRGSKKRPLRDLIYFADAWVPEKAAEADAISEE